MARQPTIVGIEDVGGSFAKLYTSFPKEMRKRIAVAVLAEADKLAERIGSTARVGPDAPHLANSATFKHTGLTGQAGYIEGDFGDMPASDNTETTIAESALYENYAPNKTGWMNDAADAEAEPFKKRVESAIDTAVTYLGGGV